MQKTVITSQRRIKIGILNVIPLYPHNIGLLTQLMCNQWGVLLVGYHYLTNTDSTCAPVYLQLIYSLLRPCCTAFSRLSFEKQSYKFKYWKKWTINELLFPVLNFVLVKAQCLWDVAIKMNSIIDSTNMLVANLKPLYWGLWPPWFRYSVDSTNALVANLKSLYWALWPRWLRVLPL